MSAESCSLSVLARHPLLHLTPVPSSHPAWSPPSGATAAMLTPFTPLLCDTPKDSFSVSFEDRAWSRAAAGSWKADGQQNLPSRLPRTPLRTAWGLSVSCFLGQHPYFKELRTGQGSGSVPPLHLCHPLQGLRRLSPVSPQALYCSCFVPVYCGFIPPTYRGEVSESELSPAASEGRKLF